MAAETNVHESESSLNTSFSSAISGMAAKLSPGDMAGINVQHAETLKKKNKQAKAQYKALSTLATKAAKAADDLRATDVKSSLPIRDA